MTPEQFLQDLANKGHSRTSAYRVSGMSWHTFRQLAADYPHIEWRAKGMHDNRRGACEWQSP